MPSISSRPTSPAPASTPAAPADVANRQAATQNTGAPARSSSRASQRSEHIPLPRRASPEAAEGAEAAGDASSAGGAEHAAGTQSARPALRAPIPSSRERASASPSRESSPDPALALVLRQREQALEALGIDDTELEHLHSPGGPLAAQVAHEPQRLEASQQALSMTGAQLVEQMHHVIDAFEAENETPAEMHEDIRRASNEIEVFAETGAMTSTAHAESSSAAANAGALTLSRAPSMRNLSDSLQRTAHDMLPDPANATPDQRRAAITLALCHEIGVPNTAQMIQAVKNLGGQMRSLAARGGTNAQGALRALANGFSKVAANEFTGPAATIGASVANVGMRNAAAVFLPTFARQMLSAQVERGFTEMNISPAGRAAVGGAFAALPMLLLAMGAVRAQRNPNATAQQRADGHFARAIMGGMALSAFVGGLVSSMFGDETSGAAAQMVAFTLYTFMRDIAVQSSVRLRNRNTENRPAEAGPYPDKLHWAAISLFYGIDQYAVNQLMTQFASPSGPGAYHAHASGALQAKNAAIRAGINYVGEVLEDLTFQGIGAIRDRQPLRLGLGFEPNARNVANGMVAPWAVRTAITQTNVVFWDVIDKALGPNHPLADQLPSLTMGGVLNGVFYWPFANVGQGLPQVGDPRSDVEAPVELEEGSRHSSQHSSHAAASDGSGQVAPPQHQTDDAPSPSSSQRAA